MADVSFLFTTSDRKTYRLVWGTVAYQVSTGVHSGIAVVSSG
jgi:hypothetical protein